MKRILYIEDSLASQLVMKRQLAGLAEVAIAATLAEARQLLHQQTFNLLLADVSLPDGNGLDLVREVRSRYSPEQLPVITISVSMDQLLIVQSLQAGANDCFAKPTPWAVFLPAVQRLLTQPYVRPNDLQAVAVTWVEGTIAERFWLFCPELGLRLEGTDMDALRETMSQQIQSAVALGQRLPYVSHVKVIERLIPLAAAAKPAAAGPGTG